MLCLQEQGLQRHPGSCFICLCWSFAISVVFPAPLSREMGFDPGVFGRFDLAALVQPHLKFLVSLFVLIYAA